MVTANLHSWPQPPAPCFGTQRQSVHLLPETVQIPPGLHACAGHFGWLQLRVLHDTDAAGRRSALHSAGSAAAPSEPRTHATVRVAVPPPHGAEHGDSLVALE